MLCKRQNGRRTEKNVSFVPKLFLCRLTMSARWPALVLNRVTKKAKTSNSMTRLDIVVPDEWVIHILEFLCAIDLNLFAICSQNCCEARILDSLDQTRFGTIMCSHQSSVLWVLNALSTRDWNNELYLGNQIYLKIKELENLTTVQNSKEVADNEEMVELQLMSVPFLTLSTTDGTADGQIQLITLRLFRIKVPLM
jgi:hypothetical protein